jgi:serine/threonine protein kinase
MTLHPDVIKVAHVLAFEVDMRLLRSVEELGSGGFGKVELMENKNSHMFAVKSCSLRGKPKEFRREIESMCRLFHPCVVRCYGFSLKGSKQEGTIVMKYAKNGSLHDVLKSVWAGNPPAFWNDTEIAIIVCGIVSGLEFIHSQGIVH